MLKFGKSDPLSEQEKKNIEENAKIAAEEAIGHAQNCLKDSEFIKYKEAYERLVEKSLEQLSLIDEGVSDPVEYGFRCKDVVGKLRMIGSLLSAVEGDAGK